MKLYCVQNNTFFEPISAIILWFGIHKERIQKNTLDFNYIFICNLKNREFILNNMKFNKKYTLIKIDNIDENINEEEDLQIEYYKDTLSNIIDYQNEEEYKEFNGIYIIPNIITENLSQELISFIDSVKNTKKKEIWQTNQNVNCDFINLEENINAKSLEKEVIKIIKNIIEYNYIHYNILSKGDSGYCLRKIYGPTRLHSDGLLVDSNEHFSKKKIRNISVIIALNDNYSNGVIHFPYQNYKCKIPKYSALCFPPYWTHPHFVTTPKNGYRYTINTWLYE